MTIFELRTYQKERVRMNTDPYNQVANMNSRPWSKGNPETGDCLGDIVLSSLLGELTSVISTDICSLWKIHNRARSASVCSACGYRPDPSECVLSLEESPVGFFLEKTGGLQW